jgi:hypothetical protein
MERTGKHSTQAPLGGFLSAVAAPFRLADELVERMSFVGALRYAVQISGKDDFEVADEIGISHGYMSKVLKGTAGLYGARLIKFMRSTNCIAPIQKMACEMGVKVVVPDIAELRIAQLEAMLAEEKRAAGRAA